VSAAATDASLVDLSDDLRLPGHDGIERGTLWVLRWVEGAFRKLAGADAATIWSGPSVEAVQAPAAQVLARDL